MLGHSCLQQVGNISAIGRLRAVAACLLALTALAVQPAAASAQSAGGRGGKRPAEEQPAVEADQQRAARSLFDAGTIAFRQLRYEDALESFSQAYKLTNDPVLLFSIGMTYDRLYRLPEAVQAFESYLQAMPNAPNRPAAEERIRIIREHIEAGDNSRAATPAAAQPVAEPAPVVALPAPAVEAKADASTDDRGARVLPQWVFWVGVGVTGALVGPMTWASIDAVKAHDKYKKEATPENRRAGQDSEQRANILIGVTASVAVVTAAVGIFFTDWKGKGSSASAHSTRPRLSAWLDGRSSGVLVSQPF